MKSVETRVAESALAKVLTTPELNEELKEYGCSDIEGYNFVVALNREKLRHAGFSAEQISTLIRLGLTPTKARQTLNEVLEEIQGFSPDDWIKYTAMDFDTLPAEK